MAFSEEAYERYRAILGNANTMSLEVFLQTIFSDFLLLERVAESLLYGTSRKLTKEDLAYWLFLRHYVNGLKKERTEAQKEALRIVYFKNYILSAKKVRQALKKPKKISVPKNKPIILKTKEPGFRLPRTLPPNPAAPKGYRVVIVNGRPLIEAIE